MNPSRNKTGRAGLADVMLGEALGVVLAGALAGALLMMDAGAMAAGRGVATAGAEPAGLNADVSRAFNQYVQLAEQQIAGEVRPGGAFLMLDRLPAGGHEAAYAALRGGELRIERLETQDNGHAVECPGCMIHHWIGIVFIPGATLEKTLRLVQDYDHQAEVYAPQVVRAKLLSHTGDDFHIFMRLRQKKVITVVLDTEHDAHYDRIDATRTASRSISTRVQQVEDAGEPGERDLPEGRDGGFLWRINSYWRFVERDGGVYVQSESISLTRSIPAGLGWLVGPFVESIPRELLRATLENTRKGLMNHESAGAVASIHK
ncbi:MAG: hypothetical protein WAM91_02300 [Candidatus Acidiferrales bacterium]